MTPSSVRELTVAQARHVQREASSTSNADGNGSPGKKSVVWDSLWSVDYNYEGPRK